jgi:molecular chaperone GrpE (heat shock protein)
MPTLTSQQLTELGNNFLAFAQAVENYRIENSGTLTKAQNQQIKDFHETLLNYADDLYATSAKVVVNDVQSSLDTIKNVTTQINQTYHNLRKVQKAIDVAAAGVTLGAAIFNKNPQAIGDAISGLVDAWNANNN